MKSGFLLKVVIFVLFLILNNSFGITLVENGEPKAIIIINKESSGVITYAAAELQTYLEKISGAKLPIIRIDNEKTSEIENLTSSKNLILLGENILTQKMGFSTKEFKPDGFRIITKDNFLIIIGKDDILFDINFDKIPASAGTLYGVYRLLEELGVRWFYPSELGEVIPKKKNIILNNLDIEDAPYFPYRFAYGNFSWLRKVGYGGDRDPWATRHTFDVSWHTLPSRWRKSWWEQYSKTNPEYFCINEKGEIFNHIAFHHPGVIDKIVQEAKEYFQSDKPDGKKSYFLVIPNDYFMKICSCPVCQSKVDYTREERGWYSDYVGEAVVKVAEKLEKKFPGRYIVYCAYERYQLPPKKIEKLPSNVVLLFTKHRASSNWSKDKTKVYSTIKDWQKLKPESIYFCEYYTFGKRILPLFIPHRIAEDIKSLKKISETSEIKIKGEMHFVEGVSERSSWWFHLNEYITGKLLWNPDLDIDKLLDDYYQNFYGPASTPMKKFFSRIEEIYESEPERTLYTIEHINELDGYIKEAITKAKGTIYAERVEFINKGFEPIRAMKEKIEESKSEKLADLGTKDLVLYYSFDEGKGEIVQNHVENKFAGKIYGAKWVDGKIGKGLEFNGESDYVRIGFFSLKDTDYTIEAWIKPYIDLSKGGPYYIIGPQCYERHALKIQNSKLYLWHRDSSGAHINISSPSYSFKIGEWYHIAGTFSKTEGMALYINGELVAFDNGKNQPSAFPVCLIGASGGVGIGETLSNFYGFFKGIIDEVRIYRRSLSSSEIKQHFLNQFQK